jgi:hypothetical protein
VEANEEELAVSEDFRAALSELIKRVERLEQAQQRTLRGWANQQEAANYIHRSAEYLRQLRHEGRGPPCSNGKYRYDDLDRWMECNG